MIFSGKKYHLFWQYKKNHIPAQLFMERPSFQTFGKRKYGFSCSKRILAQSYRGKILEMPEIISSDCRKND